MLYRLAAAAALVAIGVAPAFAQNSSNLTGTDRPVAQRGMQPNVGVPGVDGPPATITGEAGLATSSSDRSGASGGAAGMSASGSSRMSGSGSSSMGASGSSSMGASGGASSSASSAMGASPGAYPVCRTRSQDSCRVAGSRR